jgi:YaiO family outer membrane protein
MRFNWVALIFTVILSSVAQPALAQQNPLALKSNGFVEAGVNHHTLSSGFPNWNGQFIRGLVESGSNKWNAELAHLSEFGDEGTYGALGNTHTWDPDWYSSITVGSSSGGFFLPQLRVDAFLNRKFLSDRSLVLTVGAGMVNAKDDHTDHSLYLGAIYYAPSNWIFEAGVRPNKSNPGSVYSSYQHIAVTHGQNKDQYITANIAWGREAYQIIGPGTVISDFSSRSGTLIWRKWVSPTWGFNLRGERYLNPTYSRSGVDASLFYDF